MEEERHVLPGRPARREPAAPHDPIHLEQLLDVRQRLLARIGARSADQLLRTFGGGHGPNHNPTATTLESNPVERSRRCANPR